MVPIMEQPQLDRDNMKLKKDQSVFIPFQEPVEGDWFEAIHGVVAIRNSETLGDPWGTIYLSPDGSGLITEDVEPGSRSALEAAMETLLNHAAQQYPDIQRRSEAEAQEAREREERTQQLRDKFEN